MTCLGPEKSGSVKKGAQKWNIRKPMEQSIVTPEWFTLHRRNEQGQDQRRGNGG